MTAMLEKSNDHVHTWYSDGELTELELILLGLTQGSQRITFTDHDSTLAWAPETIAKLNRFFHETLKVSKDGKTSAPCPLFRPYYLQYIMDAARKGDFYFHDYHKIVEIEPGFLKCGGLTLGNGAELTTKLGQTFHILGLGMQQVPSYLSERLDKIAKQRRNRAKEILEFLYRDDYFNKRTLQYLKASQGIIPAGVDEALKRQPVIIDDVLAVNPNAPSRLTIGFLLSQRYGQDVYGNLTPEQVRDIYLQREMIKSQFKIPSFSPKEQIKAILDSGGSSGSVIPVLAHPDEGRRQGWLEGNFGALEALGYSVEKMLEEGAIDESDVRYAAKRSLMALFIEWGIRGVESAEYARQYGIMDFSHDTDYHGPRMKATRPITKGQGPSLKSLLNIGVVQEAHNHLYWKIRAASEYHAWQEANIITTSLIDRFIQSGTSTQDQSQIITAIPKELTRRPTLAEYLSTFIYSHNDYYTGTVLDIDTKIKQKLEQAAQRGRFVKDSSVNEQIIHYLDENVDVCSRKKLLVEYVPQLHNIGKVLSFGIEETPEGRYRTTFVQHDKIGAELIDKIRDVLMQDLGLTNKEIDYIRDIATDHVRVHESIYNVMGGIDVEQELDTLKSNVTLDCLLVAKAAGTMSYSGPQDCHNKYFAAANNLIKACTQRIRR